MRDDGISEASEGAQDDEAQRLVGTVIGAKWRLDRLIGMGGMASVYAATHRNGRTAAIKLLNTELSHGAEVRDRFLREGYVANRIGHPGVVSIVDDDVTAGGQAYLVMELLEGDSFSARIRKHQLTPAQVVFIGQQVLEPLGVAHRCGIIHRDIKPANVFVCKDGRVKILDFGLARLLEGSDLEPTHDGLVHGTVPYLSPEEASAGREEVDWRSDIYSVGAMLFYALSGRYVHEGNSQFDQLLAASKSPARSLTSVFPAAPAKVVELVDHALRYHPAERWQCAEDMAEAARAAFQQLTGTFIPVTERVEVDGKQGWARAALRPATTPGPPEGEEVVLHEGSIAVSVVFEPDTVMSTSLPDESGK